MATAFIFDILLRGFAPIIPGRPWVVDQILNSLKLKKYKKAYALGSGKSGFLHEFEKMFPTAVCIGIEHSWFPYFVSKTQVALRRLIGKSTRIVVTKRVIDKVNLRDAEVIYNHLYPEEMGDLGTKMKFECRPGTIVISTGFMIPGLDLLKFVTLDEREGRFAWLSRHRQLFKSKRKKSVKENRAFFYEI